MMNIYNYLPTFEVLEPNILKGLQPGFVVAQMEVAASEKPADATGALPSGSILKLVEEGDKRHLFLENGKICMISKDGIKKWDGEAVPFISFNEELLTYTSEKKHYATDIDEELPRLVQLIPGDEWMSTIDYDKEYSGVTGFSNHIVKLTSADAQSKDDWYSVSTLANGSKAYHYMYLG